MSQVVDLAASVGAYERAREAILTGALTPGTTYTQAELTSRLGVGRTPLREAVRRLQSEGLLVQEPNRRLRISPLTTHDLNSLYAMRIVLEPLAVRLTVPQLTEADASILSESLATMEEALARGDFAAIVAPHRLFHHILFSRAGDRHVRVVEELRDQSDRYRRLVIGGVSDSVAPLSTTPGHSVIAEAALSGDAHRCGELVAQHLGRAALFIFAELEGTFEPTGVRAALQFARFGFGPPAQDGTSAGAESVSHATRVASRAGAAAA